MQSWTVKVYIKQVTLKIVTLTTTQILLTITDVELITTEVVLITIEAFCSVNSNGAGITQEVLTTTNSCLNCLSITNQVSLKTKILESITEEVLKYW